MNKIKQWYTISAIKDIQSSSNSIIIGVLLTLHWSLLVQYSLIVMIIYFLLVFYFYDKYHKKGLRYYYYAICGDIWVEPKTQNITFK